MTHHEDTLAVLRYAHGRSRDFVLLHDERANERANGIRPPPLVATAADGDEPDHGGLLDVSERDARRSEDGILIERGAVFAVLDDRLPEPACEPGGQRSERRTNGSGAT